MKPVGLALPPLHAVELSPSRTVDSASRTHFLSVGSSEEPGSTSKARRPACRRTRMRSLPPLVPRQFSMRVRTGAMSTSTSRGSQPSVFVTVRRHRGAGAGGPSAVDAFGTLAAARGGAVCAAAVIAGRVRVAGCAPQARVVHATMSPIGGRTGRHLQRSRRDGMPLELPPYCTALRRLTAAAGLCPFMLRRTSCAMTNGLHVRSAARGCAGPGGAGERDSRETEYRSRRRAEPGVRTPRRGTRDGTASLARAQCRA